MLESFLEILGQFLITDNMIIFTIAYFRLKALVARIVKNLPTMRETWVWSLGWEGPLEKGMATHSSILAWKNLWMKEPGRYSPWGCRVGHNWATNTEHRDFRLMDFTIVLLHICDNFLLLAQTELLHVIRTLICNKSMLLFVNREMCKLTVSYSSNDSEVLFSDLSNRISE